MQVRSSGCARRLGRGTTAAAVAACSTALTLTCLVGPGNADQSRASPTASSPAVVSAFFEVAEWRQGTRRRLVQLRVLGVISGEHVLTGCSHCGGLGFSQRWGTNRVTLVAHHPLRMGHSTRVIVATTAPASVGRWIVIDYSHHQYRGVGHGCMPASVTKLPGSAASDPSRIPRASCAGPCPSPVGTAYVDWQGTDGQLWEFPWNGRQWGAALPVGSGALGSPPAVVVRAGGQRDVFWRGRDHRLTEMWYGGFWNGPIELRAAGRLRSPPAAAVDGHGVEHVFWEGSNRWLWELSDPGGVWSASYPVDSGRIGSTPAAVPNAGGGEDIFWKGASGRLWEIRNPTSAGSAHRISGAGTLGSGPTAVSDANGVDHVFWKGTNGWLWEISDPGGAWGASVPLNSGRLGSAPSAVVEPGGEIEVFWRGTDGRLRELQSTSGGWRDPIRVDGSGSLGSRPGAAVGRCLR